MSLFKGNAMRCAMALLLLAAALIVASVHAAPVAAYTLEAPVSGSTYFWQAALEFVDKNATLKAATLAAMKDDIQTAAGTDVTITVTGYTTNASAMYILYSAVPTLGTSDPSEATVVSNVKTNASFPKLSMILEEIRTGLGITDLIPADLHVVTPLYADPNAADASTLVFVSNVTYEVVLLLNGTPSVWTTLLEADRATVAEKLGVEVGLLMNSSRQAVETSVYSLKVLPADNNHKTMGSGTGGLVANMILNCGATSAMTGRFLSTAEVAGLMLMLDTTSLTALYQAQSGTTLKVAVEESTPTAALVKSITCDNACKGMIAMTAVVVALCVVAVIVALVAICCPCGYLRPMPSQKTEELRSLHDPTEEQPLDLLSDTQNGVPPNAILVDADDNVVESHDPATVPPKKRVCSEPDVE